MNLAFVVYLWVWLAPGAASDGPVPARTAYRLVQDSSRVWIVTHRSGLLAFLGHEHAIVPRDWSATLCLSDPIAVGDEASVVVRTASLIIDADSARALAGLGDGPDAADRDEIQEKMLDAEHLDVARFPEARLELTAVARDTQDVAVKGTLTLHGTEREVEVPVRSRRLEDRRLRLDGAINIRQRDFGIEPESIGGFVKVSNKVDLHFVLMAVPTGEECPARF